MAAAGVRTGIQVSLDQYPATGGTIRRQVGEGLSADVAIMATGVPMCQLLDSDCVFHSPGVNLYLLANLKLDQSSSSWVSDPGQSLRREEVCASTSRGLVNVQCQEG